MKKVAIPVKRSLQGSNIEVKLDFNENLREYNVNIKSNGSSTNIEGYIKSSIGSINLDNYLVFQPGDKNRQMEINNDTISKFIVPDLEDKEKVEFKIRTVDLPEPIPPVNPTIFILNLIYL